MFFFADVEKDNYSIDPDKIEEILKKHADIVQAIVPVHIAGNICNMERIMELVKIGLSEVEVPWNTKN